MFLLLLKRHYDRLRKKIENKNPIEDLEYFKKMYNSMQKQIQFLSE